MKNENSLKEVLEKMRGSKDLSREDLKNFEILYANKVVNAVESTMRYSKEMFPAESSAKLLSTLSLSQVDRAMDNLENKLQDLKGNKWKNIDVIKDEYDKAVVKEMKDTLNSFSKIGGKVYLESPIKGTNAEDLMEAGIIIKKVADGTYEILSKKLDTNLETSEGRNVKITNKDVLTLTSDKPVLVISGESLKILDGEGNVVNFNSKKDAVTHLTSTTRREMPSDERASSGVNNASNRIEASLEYSIHKDKLLNSITSGDRKEMRSAIYDAVVKLSTNGHMKLFEEIDKGSDDKILSLTRKQMRDFLEEYKSFAEAVKTPTYRFKE